MTPNEDIHIPYLRQTATSKQLVVDGEPFLMLAGELQNSSFSSVEYMKDVWDNVRAMNLNTVLANVSWEQIEPVEGTFNFQVLDQQIINARTHGLRLVLLWFGSFKNGLSTYTPKWVKQNPTRFPRAKLGRSRGTTLETGDVLSLFSNNAKEADAKAFGALMQHLRHFDARHSTVIMVQVENEVGLLGDSRDRCIAAEKAYSDTIPSDFVRFLAGDWSQMNVSFKNNFQRLQHEVQPESRLSWSDLSCDEMCRDELFMAYHYARYVNDIASAGKAAYPLPLYTNVWQNYADSDRDVNIPLVAAGGSTPGDYPSGGGVANVLDVWQTFAPSLDFIAPDIYLNDYERSCAKYRHRDQPLFIPEQRRDEYGALRVWSAFGSYSCIGTAPFGIDTLPASDSPFTRHYALLAKISPILLAAQARPNSSFGFFFDELREGGTDHSPAKQVKFGTWILTIEQAFVFGKPSSGCGLVIHLDEDQFLLVGWGFQVRFESTHTGVYFTGILRFEEKEVDGNQVMRTIRLLNGDETRSGKCAVMPSLDPDYGDFPISITIPARTGIAMCQPYVLSG